ncbi:MAG: alpha/beta hydrolase [Ignavibacteriae bacterium HGW-Ignavibacteriae-3]|nr:MAG: alpha/beta hydrolase [Ignavibacteriae bacterium HGW-Ignavibacteriae-3]
MFITANNFIIGQEDQKTDEKQFTSLWEGRLKISTVSLKLILKTFNNDDGTQGAFLDSPDQGAKNIPATSITFNDDSLKFAISSLGASYAGKVVKDSAIIKGTFKQADMSFPLDMKKIDKLTEVKRPQEPKKPYPYNDEEVTFENKSAGIILAGTFTYPKEEGKYPAVVLVTGSGPQDRDETLGGGINHKPFLVLSDYLTRNGIAVLRYDDRGIAKSKGNFATATTEDFASDALAAVEYLKTRKEADPKKIGIAGHSEGGLIAPMVAVNSNDVAFIILLAGPGLPGKDILLMQGRLMSKAAGAKDEDIDNSMQLSEKIYDILFSEKDNAIAEKKIRDAYVENYNTLSDEKKKEADAQKPIVEQNIRQLTSPWFRFFLKFDPRPVLENVTVPVLALNGEKDLQVPAKEDLSEIEKALKAGGNKNFKIVLLPNLNHLFQNCKTGALSEYGQIQETFSPDAMKIISDWILSVVK